MNRRSALAILSAAIATPSSLLARTAQEISWYDLIPPGVPLAEIIGEGELDEANDTWYPIYDANGAKLNPALDGALIKMPGFIIPFDVSADGVSSFMLVPYVGACIHTPPPPANQLVSVTTDTPWPNDELWAPAWVTGTMRNQIQSTEFGDTGYAITAEKIEAYEW